VVGKERSQVQQGGNIFLQNFPEQIRAILPKESRVSMKDFSVQVGLGFGARIQTSHRKEKRNTKIAKHSS
jgi:hypothetical protein